MTQSAIGRIAKWVVLTLGILIAALLLWGVLIEPRLIDVERETAMIPDLPPEWEGQRIAVIADLQVGMWMANTGTAHRIARRLVAMRPAAVLIAGDFLYQADPDPAPEIREAVDIVRPVPAAGIPTLAVLGNHDHSLDEPDDREDERMAARLRQALEEAGVRVLVNDTAALRLPAAETRATAGVGDATDGQRDTARARGGSAPLYIAGIASNWAREDRPAATMRKVPMGAARVALMHNPNSFGSIPAGEAPLALAAHTHGGQIRLPFTPEWSWLTFVKGDSVHADGWIRDGYGAPGNLLYVNTGIGFSDVPIRINTLPVITVFTLRRGVPTLPPE